MINFLAAVLLSITYHAHHISVCEVTYKQNTNTLEVVQQVFADDLESYVKLKTNNPNFDIRYNLETNSEVIKKFALDFFKIKLNNTHVDFEWVGYKIVDNDMKLFFEYKNIEGERLVISNSIFIDYLHGQENVIHFLKDNSKQTKVCTKSNREVSFDLH